MLKTEKLNRRQVVKLAAASAASVVAAPMVAKHALAAQEITLFTWETYHEDSWIAEWTKKTGVPVKVVRTGSVDEMFAQTQSGAIQADVLYFDSGSFKRYKDAGLIAPFDATKIPNIGSVTAGLKWEERNAIDGKVWGLPYNWGTQPLMYDESAMEKPDSWAALWDPKNAGKVNMFVDSSGANIAMSEGFVPRA